MGSPYVWTDVGLGFQASGLGLRILGLGFWATLVTGLVCRVCDFRYRGRRGQDEVRLFSQSSGSAYRVLQRMEVERALGGLWAEHGLGIRVGVIGAYEWSCGIISFCPLLIYTSALVYLGSRI